MNLPEYENLSINALSRVFSDMSESYKIFWFMGILDIIKEGKTTATFNEIINHMIIEAWYMVSEYHLNLGPSDTLEKLIRNTQKECGLKTSAKPGEILNYLENCDNDDVARYKSTLTLNVPYRFQAPFMPDFRGKSWGRTSDVITRVNLDSNMIYHFRSGSGLHRTIEISPEWVSYFSNNQAIILGWLEFNLITYLQKRNPSVPGISNKLSPPSERKLDKAKKFWKTVIDFKPIVNIYSINNDFLSINDVSIDHFIPWSYVAHDELWNLVPTTRSLNSKKSNELPDFNHYFPILAEIEYCSYQSIWESEQVKVLFEKCRSEHINSNEANKLYVPGINKIEFSNHLEELILPSYTAAKNLGFGEWKYE